MKNKYLAITAGVGLMALAACNKGGFEGPDRSMYDVVETMTLEASSSELTLDAEAPDDVVLTFSWTPAREMSDDYIVTYVTQLDIEGNDFGNSVREVEEDGVYTKSYTNQQLQDYLVDKWGKSYVRAVNMEFRVIAKWDGGTKYAMPEVREVGVSVRPFRPLVFEADRVFLSGSSLTGTTKLTMPKTPENEFIYAEEVYLKPGELTIPIEYDGVTTYICPEKEGAVVEDVAGADGTPVSNDFNVKVRESEVAWQIPVEGYYRVIIDMENKQVKIYSPQNRLEPLTVEFDINGVEGNGRLRKTITSLLHYGDASWSGASINFMQSKTDPQLFIYKSGTLKWNRFNFKTGNKVADYEVVEEGTFDLTKVNASNVWTISPLQENLVSGVAPVTLGEWIPIAGGSSWNRGAYFRYANGTKDDGTPNWGTGSYTSIILDLRNMRMRLD